MSNQPTHPIGLPSSPAENPEKETTFDVQTARFLELARIGRGAKHSGGTIKCVSIAEWLWQTAPAIANVDRDAVAGLICLIELAHSNPHLVREILQEECALNEKGEAPNPRSI